MFPHIKRRPMSRDEKRATAALLLALHEGDVAAAVGAVLGGALVSMKIPEGGLDPWLRFLPRRSIGMQPAIAFDPAAPGHGEFGRRRAGDRRRSATRIQLWFKRRRADARGQEGKRGGLVGGLLKLWGKSGVGVGSKKITSLGRRRGGGVKAADTHAAESTAIAAAAAAAAAHQEAKQASPYTSSDSGPGITPRMSAEWDFPAGSVALHAACYGGHARVVEALANAGADCNVAEPVEGCSPLFLAASRGHLAAAQAVLEHGGAVDAAQGEWGKWKGCACLHFAVKRDDDGLVAWLLQRGAGANVADMDGNTPLHFAVALVNVRPMIERLLVAGGDLHRANAEGATPMECAGRLWKDGWELAAHLKTWISALPIDEHRPVDLRDAAWMAGKKK